MRAERRFFVTFGPCSWILGSLQRTAADACAQKVFSTGCFILLVAPLSLAGSRSDAFVELNPLPMRAERRFFVTFGPCSWILGSLQRTAADACAQKGVSTRRFILPLAPPSLPPSPPHPLFSL